MAIHALLSSALPFALWCLLFSSFGLADSLHVTSIPPLLDVPTFSLSTLGGQNGDAECVTNDVSTMNILTYAAPASVRPDRVWSIGLFKGTLSHENFARRRKGILQLLRPEHAAAGAEAGELVKILGGCSGRDVDKASRCAELGFPWTKLEVTESSAPSGAEREIDDEWPLVLPSCIYYLKLELIGDLIDCGSHDVALCRVVSTIADDGVRNADEELDYLSTRRLRELGIISELGRVVQPDE